MWLSWDGNRNRARRLTLLHRGGWFWPVSDMCYEFYPTATPAEEILHHSGIVTGMSPLTCMIAKSRK